MTPFKKNALLALLLSVVLAQPVFAYDETWDETTPADHSKFSAQPGAVRDVKTAVRERMQGGGAYWPSTDDSSAGQWSYTLYREQGSNPASAANTGRVFTKEVSSRTELHYIDDAGNVSQLTPLTSGIKLPSGAVFFMITGSCPSGSTDVSATYSDKFPRINSTAGSTGGADTHTHTAGTFVGPAHTHTVPASSTGWGAGSATSGKLTTGQDGGTSATTDRETSSSGTGSITGTSASSNNIPAYFTVKLCQVS